MICSWYEMNKNQISIECETAWSGLISDHVIGLEWCIHWPSGPHTPCPPWVCSAASVSGRTSSSPPSASPAPVDHLRHFSSLPHVQIWAQRLTLSFSSFLRSFSSFFLCFSSSNLFLCSSFSLSLSSRSLLLTSCAPSRSLFSRALSWAAAAISSLFCSSFSFSSIAWRGDRLAWRRSKDTVNKTQQSSQFKFSSLFKTGSYSTLKLPWV